LIWPDALREKAEIVDGDEREQLFKQAHHKYKVPLTQRRVVLSVGSFFITSY
jgi:hypothetical protein